MSLSPVCTDLDEELEKFYVQSKLTVIQAREEVLENTSNKIEGKEIFTYKQLFNIGYLKNIYIQGNAGMGKSTYSMKLTLDWCTCIDPNEKNKKRKNVEGLEFEFLFLISLRDSRETCDVFQMVKKAVIRRLLYQRIYNDGFLSKVLDTERCLIILDGLDEWTHPETGACDILSAELIPHRAAGGKCVYITLTRPWKLSQICLKDSEKDVLLEINGVSEPKQLISNVINSLNKKEKKSRDVDAFYTATGHLTSLLSIPIMCMQLVCIWHEKGTIPSCQCGIYCAMIKMILEKDKDKGKKSFSTQSLQSSLPRCFRSYEWAEPDIGMLRHLGKLAFETLFPEDGHPSHIVFNDDIVDLYLGEELKMKAFAVGLLTEYKIRSLNQKKSHASFLHKTFQEFLAAFYLSLVYRPLEPDQKKNMVSRVNVQGENINDIAQLFLFLCGMAPLFATSVSEGLMTATTRLLKKHRITNNGESFVKNIAELLYKGYTECVQNGHGNVSFQLTHIYFGRHSSQPKELIQHNLKKIETIWCDDICFSQKVRTLLNSCSKTIATLCLPYNDKCLDLNMYSSLQAFKMHESKIERNAVLDMSNCQCLGYLNIVQANLAVIIVTDQLKYCKLRYCDLSEGNVLEMITKRNTQLTNLSLTDCTFPKLNGGENTSFHLDLTLCSSLEKLRISPRNGDISLTLSAKHLEKYRLAYIDLSRGNLLEALSNSNLKYLRLYNCCFPPTNQENRRTVCIDVSMCTDLTYIYVYGSHVEVKYKNDLIGGDKKEWGKR